MFAIDFEYFSIELKMHCTDTFECEKSFKEFLNWIEDHEILNYKILDIQTY